MILDQVPGDGQMDKNSASVVRKVGGHGYRSFIYHD